MDLNTNSYYEKVQKNGLTIIILKNKCFKTATVIGAVKYGRRYDKFDFFEASHFIEHLAFNTQRAFSTFLFRVLYSDVMYGCHKIPRHLHSKGGGNI